MERLLFTSESVTEGHPDKVCDAVSDAILDALLEQDPMSRVACETCTTTGLVMVMGEITSKMCIRDSCGAFMCRNFVRHIDVSISDLYRKGQGGSETSRRDCPD